MRLRKTDADSSIPTSSMADIAFLLIIFFMVTSVFSATKGLEFALPTDDHSPPDPTPDPAVFIHVQADRVVVDCREMGVDEILPYLEPKLLRNPNKPVILYTDPEATYPASDDSTLKLALEIDAAVKRVRPDGWRGIQSREKVIKQALYEILQVEAEVERIFLIVKAQGEY